MLLGQPVLVEALTGRQLIGVAHEIQATDTVVGHLNAQHRVD